MKVVGNILKLLWEYISGETRFLMTKQQMVTAITASIGCFHIFLLFFFLSQKVTVMAIFNVFSVLFYATCVILTRKNVKPLVLFDLSYAEVVIHAVTASLMVGLGSGFALYLVAMIPLAYYAAYSFREDDSQINPMFYVIISVIGFCLTRILCRFVPSVYTYSSHVETGIYMVNYFIVVIAVVAFMSTFLIQFITLEETMLEQNKKLEVMSTVDALTGLRNRRSIRERYHKAQREREQYALILGDIDDFKKVNDTYGHESGDVVLKQVAEVFRNSVRADDIVCRWGGEEILVFLPTCAKKDAVVIANRILESIRELDICSADGEQICVTMTIGVAESAEAEAFKEVTKMADDRLYIGKRTGKNRVVFEQGEKAS